MLLSSIAIDLLEILQGWDYAIPLLVGWYYNFKHKVAISSSKNQNMRDSLKITIGYVDKPPYLHFLAAILGGLLIKLHMLWGGGPKK